MHPILIVGAALVGLPILLHLIMKQEPKRLPFPAFRFLRQKLKTNQRKLRLRHFLLLAMRMLLIALFALALYQPTLLSQRFNIVGDQPLAVVIVIDTSPSMGYAPGDKTRLDEAKRRALELLDGIPDGSRVAVIDTADSSGDWLPSVGDARKRINEIKEPKGAAQPITSALGTAYQLLRTVDAESDATEPLPRLVAVFTDRAAACWEPSRVEDLKKLRDGVPDPKPAHAIVDVGADQPANVAILSAEMKPQVISTTQSAVVTVTVAATGPDVEAVVKAQIDGADSPVRKPVAVPGGQSRPLSFEFKDLKPGLHQLKFELETKDSLMVDNTRFLTFRVAEARKVLTIADDPDEAGFWKLALDVNGMFDCEIAQTASAPAEFGKYEAVCLFAVGHPNQPADNPLWPRLLKYVEGGGKLVIVPGDKERMALEEYDPSKVDAANRLLPGTLKDVIDTGKEFAADPKRKGGVSWPLFTANDEATDRLFQHPMLAPFKEWKARGGVDLFVNPRKVQRYWDVERKGDGQVIVPYDDSDDPAKRRPAVLERGILDTKDKVIRGRVILLTTTMDTRPDDASSWNDYWRDGTSWSVVFPELLLRYAAGNTADANFNYLTGQTVTVPLAKLLAGKRESIAINNPNITGTDAVVRPAERQTELRLGPPKTNAPGNYEVVNPAQDWKEGFSLNIPADESNLEKVPVEGIEELTGKDTVVPVGKDLDLREALAGKETFRTPVDLFPWLLIAVLMLLVLEGFVANRFYRRPSGK